jgi:hypothetical protein
MNYESDEELRFGYGNHAVISHKRQFTFIHLDNPSPELVEAREKNDELSRPAAVRVQSANRTSSLST